MPHPRDRILSTAADLFYRKGLQHVGVNEVITSAEVAKRTFYRHFSSKDELILAVMRCRAEEWLQWFTTEIEQRGSTADEKLLASFEILQEWYGSPGFRGCPFVNAVVELGNPAHPAHEVSVLLRQTIREYVAELATAAAVNTPEIFAQQYLLLLGGSVLVATIEGAPVGAEYARQTLAALLDQSIKSKDFRGRSKLQ